VETVLDNIDVLMSGLYITVQTAAATLTLCTILGLLVAGMRLVPATKGLAIVYTEFFQNIPYVILVFFIYYGLPSVGIRLGPIATTIIGIGLYSSAYIAEALRTGILAVPKGNSEAGYATGLSQYQVIRYIVLQQGLLYAMPSLMNQWCRALRNVSVMAIIGGQEILFEASQLADSTFLVITYYSIAGFAYWVLSFPILAMGSLVRRFSPWMDRL
jgi:putative glutamine transport system permease protein